MKEIIGKQLFENSGGGWLRLLNALEPRAIMSTHNNEGEVVQSVALSPSLGLYNLLR